MAKKATYTNAVIDLFKRHAEIALPSRRKRHTHDLPLWAILKSVRGRSDSKIEYLLNGGSYRNPYKLFHELKSCIAARIARGKQITDLQFELIDEYLVEHGYTKGSQFKGKLSIPKDIMVVACRFTDDSYGRISTLRWWRDIERSLKYDLTLRAILDPVLTDLILAQALGFSMLDAKVRK